MSASFAPGDEPGQGVGYLDDGTMVVVENGRPYVAYEVQIIVTSVLQTSAGRMIFGKFDRVVSPASDSDFVAPRPPPKRTLLPCIRVAHACRSRDFLDNRTGNCRA